MTADQWVPLAIKKLAPHGQAVRQYITAGLEGGVPHLGDLVFVPYEGARADAPHVVEFRIREDKLLDSIAIRSVVEHGKKIREANASAVHFALATNARVPHKHRVELIAAEIKVFDGLSGVDDLVKRILEWA